MKRAISTLGALALVAGFFTLGAPAAHAYTIDCEDISSSLTVFPYTAGTVQKCGTVSNSKALGMSGTLYSLISSAPDAYDKMAADSTVKFRIFKNLTEYDQFFDERVTTPPAGTTAADWNHTEPAAIGPLAWGHTIKTYPGRVPIWTAIFTFDLNNVSIDTYANIGWVTTHEAGHWFEYYYESVVKSDISTPTAAESQMYKDLLVQDWVNFDELVNCGTGGVFNGKKPENVSYMCSGGSHGSLPMNSPYSGSNTNKLNLELSYGSLFLPREETFATEVARMTGYSDNGTLGASSFVSSANSSVVQCISSVN